MVLHYVCTCTHTCIYEYIAFQLTKGTPHPVGSFQGPRKAELCGPVLIKFSKVRYFSATQLGLLGPVCPLWLLCNTSLHVACALCVELWFGQLGHLAEGRMHFGYICLGFKGIYL